MPYLDRFRVQANASIESAERQAGAAFAHLRRSAAVRAVDKLPVEILPRAHLHRQRRHVEIRIYAAVERLEVQVGVEIRLEVDVHRTVECLEGAVALRVLAKLHTHAAVEGFHPTGAGDIFHFDPAVEAVDIEIASGSLD